MFGFNSDKNKSLAVKNKANFLNTFFIEKNKPLKNLFLRRDLPGQDKNNIETEKIKGANIKSFQLQSSNPAEIKNQKNKIEAGTGDKRDGQSDVIPAKKDPDWAKELNERKISLAQKKNEENFLKKFLKKIYFFSKKKENEESIDTKEKTEIKIETPAIQNIPAADSAVEKISIKELREKNQKMKEAARRKIEEKKSFWSFFQDSGENQEWDEENHDPSKPIIETKNLSVTYNLGKSNELHALKDASIKIYPGEYIIMYGPSGCGKSTLLFAIAGLQSPTKGNVIIDGVDISRLKKNSRKIVEFHRTKIGIIFQAFHLIPSLNIFKNVALPQIFSGISLNIRKKKVMNLLERFEISSQSEKLPSQLSGGQKQRVAIARALINDPKILLADEPVGNLDSKSAETVLGILKELNERDNRTVILVTHDSRHLNFAHRVFHLQDGIVIRETVNKDIRPQTIQIQDAERPQISQEMELLMRTYSGLSSSQLGGMLIPYKAKQLVQDVLIGISSEQVKVMEKAVEEFLMNINSGTDYRSISGTLDSAIERGGAGLDKRTAKNLEEKIKAVLEEVKYLTKEEEAAKEEYKISDGSKKVQHLRKFILEKYNIAVQKEEIIKRLDQALELRLKNQLDSFRLRKFLDKPFEKGGAGLDKRNAKKITKEMELMMLLKFK